MKLQDVLKGIDTNFDGAENIEITGLYHNSKEVKKGGMFFAIDGTKQNGEDYVLEAIKNGAVAIVSRQKLPLEGAINIVVDDVRKVMSLAASNFYENPSKDMLVLSVTGTNGKTTTTYMLKSIFEADNKKVGVIGTNGIFIGNEKIGADLTTPDPIFLNQTLAYFKENGVEVVCLEASAHALQLQKLWGIMTDIALFTNLTQDHLDFFSDMVCYGNAKAKLFKKEFSKYAVYNIDDPFGKELFLKSEIPAISYSRQKDSGANIIAINQTHNNFNQSFAIKFKKYGLIEFKLNLEGGFNVSNALGAICAAMLAKVKMKSIVQGLANLNQVEGRFNTSFVRGVRVVIDYAHTPDGLSNILSATREITGGKVFCVFGCGGNRDKAKRPIMGSIAEKLADYTIITNDNPRLEDPKSIAKEIVGGFKGGNYKVELDRAEAICLALSMAKPNDSVVIAGKGAEPYMDIGGKKIPYEDKKVVENYLKKR